MSSSSPSAFESLKEKKQARAQWSRLLKDALDADSWGQSIEATEQYEKSVDPSERAAGRAQGERGR